MNRKVSGILNRYAKLPAGRVPRSVNVDFKTILVTFGTAEMGASVSAAFRSNATPSVAEIVSEWYKKAPRKDRAAFLRRLDTMLRDAGLDWLLTPTDEFPGLDIKVTTAENLGQFVRVV